MAEFDCNGPDLDDQLHDDLLVKDVRDDDDDEQVNTIGCFQPGTASTPWGEEIQMQTRQHEKSGLPDYEIIQWISRL